MNTKKRTEERDEQNQHKDNTKKAKIRQEQK